MSAITEVPESGSTEAPERVEEWAGDARKAAPARQNRRRLRRDGHRVSRWIHTYLSMVSLALVLFFGATGLTLNHPEWTFGLAGSTETFSGVLPASTGVGTTSIDFLAISQFVQMTNGASGEVVDYSADATSGVMTFKGPGYAADLFFDPSTGSYDLNVDRQGLIAVANDLHKGRNTGGAWNWTIDAAAGVLVTVALSGLALQFFLSKRRTRAYITAAVGTAIAVLLILTTTA